MTEIDKALLRREVCRRRAAMTPAERASASVAASSAIEGLLDRPLVGLFWPLREEIDTRPLLPLLAARGHRPLLPRMRGFRQALGFREWHQDLVLEEGRFRVMEPPERLPVMAPAIVVTPLVAFDRCGHRLGYGAGFYDRTFAELVAAGLRPLRIGFAFACQEVEEVPVGPHDQPLDLVVTETGRHHITHDPA